MFHIHIYHTHDVEMTKSRLWVLQKLSFQIRLSFFSYADMSSLYLSYFFIWCLHPVAYRLWSLSGYVGLLEKQNFVRKINYFLITILTSERAKKGKKVSTWKVFDGNWWQFLVKNDRGKNWPQLQSKLWRQRSVTPRCIYLQMSVKSFSKSIGRHWLS